MSTRYKLLAPLASPGPCPVFRAWDHQQNRDVAYLRLGAVAGDPAEVERTARRMYALRHPRIVTTVDYGRDEQGVFMVQEMLPGERLSELAARAPLQPAEVIRLAGQVLEGLDAAHSAGVTHGALTPQCLVLPWDLGQNWQLKITGWELAPSAGLPLEALRYRAPELFDGHPAEVSSDLYALGAICLFALTGRHAFEGDSADALAEAHRQHRLAPGTDLPSTAFTDWVLSLLQPQPQHRPASAAAALKALRTLPAEEVVAMPVLEAEPVLLAAPVLAEPVLAEAEPVVAAVAAVEPVEEPAPPPVAEVIAARPEPEPVAFEPEPEPEPEPVEQPLAPPVAFAPPAAVESRAVEAPPPRQAPERRAAASAAPPKRRFGLSFIIGSFAVMMVGQLAVISYIKYSSRDDRDQRFAELNASATPRATGLDVDLLLDYLLDPATRQDAARTLVRLPAGNPANERLLTRFKELQNHAVCATLVEVIGERGMQEAFPALLALTGDSRGDVRGRAWQALGRLTPEQGLSELLKAAQQSKPRDREEVERALSGFVAARDNPKAALQLVFKAYRDANDERVRTLFFNVITRTEGPEALEVLSEALKDPSPNLRLAAITTLAYAPTRQPLTAIVNRFPDETDEECRTYLLLAARELVNMPGPGSQHTLSMMIQGLYPKARTLTERRYLLSIVGRILSPRTLQFLQQFDTGTDPELQREVRELRKNLEARLERVITLAGQPGETTELGAKLADYTLGTGVSLEGAALVNWTQPEDSASWWVEVPNSGRYEIAIYQAQPKPVQATYEVLLAGQRLLTAVVQTRGPNDFKGFVVGELDVPEAGLYRLQVRPRTLPEGAELFRVQKLVLRPVPKKG